MNYELLLQNVRTKFFLNFLRSNCLEGSDNFLSNDLGRYPKFENLTDGFFILKFPFCIQIQPKRKFIKGGALYYYHYIIYIFILLSLDTVENCVNLPKNLSAKNFIKENLGKGLELLY